VDRLGETTLVEPELTQVNSFIDYATPLLRSQSTGLDARILLGTLDLEIVKGVLVSAVVRALTTMRRGLRVRSMQYPEVTEQYADAPDELVYFTPGELASVSATSGSTGGAFNIRPGAIL
jgi:hypothetical protein